ncbi:TonB-dependent receptor domain-containing protein [Flavobacterium sp.]|jgi:outer membrane receptor protein involved in Fe transport|uniref:TonB-dependent receptor n=1 Tax=Flavobacterium sp. TaxID=239 RepID=UPI0037BE589E
MKLYLFVLSLFFCSITFAQSSISGTVVDAANQPIPGASIKIVGEAIGTVTDFDGKFTLATQKNPPYTIEVSSIGFSTQKVEIKSNKQVVNAKLTEEETKLNEIVVSASRTPERILESPVTIERMGMADVKNTTAVSFYEGLENLKEVQVNTSSLSFKSVNTRGFATIANTRFMQLVDGMDNSSPALNFVLGNLIGLNDLDVQSVELLPGASSALYGANAFNGILFMNSKNPFDYQGISTYVKGGVTSQEIGGTNNYLDVGFRAAHKFSDVFAAKWNINFLDATEWIAGDTRSVTSGGNTRINPNYDGLNVYGDEVTTFIPNVGQVSRTGYLEQNMNDNTIESVKSDISLHFKPWKNDLEFVAQYKVGLGNTIYQGANRYRLENFLMQQVRLEVRNRNFFVRAYVTTEDAGDSYDMRFAAWNVNRAAKSDQGWFTDYATAFLQSQIFLGFNADQAAAAARNFATNNTPITGLNLVPNGQAQFQPGTPQFAQALETVASNPDLTQGAKFIDNSRIYHSDANYNFKEVIKFAEFQVGGSYRVYELNSQGTIFTDFDGPIDYSEYGVYVQGQKKLMDDRLKLTASVRYDKSELFDGQYSPRVSFVYSAGDKKNHNFRASYQTGFRNPTTQDLYIGLNLGPFALIGSAADNLDRYQETLPVSLQGQTLPGVGSTVTLSGQNAYNNAYTIPSVQAFAASGNPDDLEVANIGLVKPEQVQAFEVGYKSIVEGLSVDLNAYYNIYNDFMSTSRVITPYYGTVGNDPSNPSNLLSYAALANGDRRVFQVYSNSTSEITSLGFGVGLNKKVYQNYELGVNYNYAEFDFDQSKDPTFIAGFNTPKHRVKGSFGSPSIFKNFGAFVNVRWSDTYLWQSSFADGTIPAVTVFDAQASYAIPSLKSVIKLSASNLFGDDYLQVIGAGLIGQTYLLSLTINP